MEHFQLPRKFEVELVYNLSKYPINLEQHFCQDEVIFIDNIHGGFDSFEPSLKFREGGTGYRYGSWIRARAISYALTSGLGANDILSFCPVNKDIQGLGVSDDKRYAHVLEYLFSYENTFFHTSPKLDIMKQDRSRIEKYDFIICSDVLEHTLGDWRKGIEYIHSYLKEGGFCVFSVPYFKDIEQTIEHYPNAIDCEIFKKENGYGVMLTYIDGSKLEAQNPVFHGGPGSTLEMRQFSFNELIDEFYRIGFTEIKVFEQNISKYGIFYAANDPGIFLLKK